jgi:hypothetical protein
LKKLKQKETRVPCKEKHAKFVRTAWNNISKTPTNNINPNCLPSSQGKWQLQKLTRVAFKVQKTMPNTIHFCQNS